MDLPEIRRSNLLHLFSEHVTQRMAHSPSQQISGLDREFAALIQVHNTYFSGMKSGARTIGDKLARQVETLSKKCPGWLDEPREVDQSADLRKFLQLAQKVYLAVPAARKDLTKILRDAMKQQNGNPPKSI